MLIGVLKLYGIILLFSEAQQETVKLQMYNRVNINVNSNTNECFLVLYNV